MQSRHNPELSLLEVVQGQSPHFLHTLGISSATHWLNGICEILVKNRVPSTLWAKFSAQSPWQASIAMYEKTGLLQQLYWCRGNNEIETAAGLRLDPELTITALMLEFNAHLQAEDFFCFLSSEISLLILLEQPDDKLDTVNILYSFCPQAISIFLEELKQGLVITDDLSVDVFTPENLPQKANLVLVNQLVQGLASFNSDDEISSSIPSSTAISQELTTQYASGFVLNLIRELGIPLTNTKTALQLLESLQQKKEVRQRYLDLIKQNCDRQTELITGLQQLLEINPIPPVAEAVQIEDCIAGVIGIYQPVAEEKTIRLGYMVAEKCPPVACIVADLRAILQRLVENSLKFTHAGGQIQVQASYHRGSEVEILIKDTGCGIAMVDIPRLFDCFFRGQNSPPEEQGAGVGLTIVQSLLQRWGGTITVHSHPGQGSNFQILLPVAVDNSIGHRFVTSE